jgi:hypothetical protein
MYMRNYSGSKFLPCGTPQVTGLNSKAVGRFEKECLEKKFRGQTPRKWVITCQTPRKWVITDYPLLNCITARKCEILYSITTKMTCIIRKLTKIYI